MLVLGNNSYLNTMSVAVSSIMQLYPTLAEVIRADDFVVSDQLVSLRPAQISENQEPKSCLLVSRSIQEAAHVDRQPHENLRVLESLWLGLFSLSLSFHLAIDFDAHQTRRRPSHSRL